jgi:NADPH2:quinone reductase
MPEPSGGPNDVLIRVEAAGVNYADLVSRAGAYPGFKTPATLGLEAAGRVVRLGSEVSDLSVGDRVAAFVLAGAQAEYVAAPATQASRYPARLSPVEAAAVPAVFLTAYYLLKLCAQPKTGDWVMIHAAASGVGTAAVQMATLWGARVIATASSEEKLATARSLGAAHGINYTTGDFEAEVKRITGGKGTQSVLECVGGEVFDKSLRCLAPFGRLVTYGMASGRVPTADAAALLFGNAWVIGFHMGRALALLDARHALREIWELIDAERLRPVVDRTFPMADAARAHAHLHARRAVGKVVLVP